MELTKEYFDEQLSKKLDQKLDEKLDEKLSKFATKEDLKLFATKDDLKAQTQELEEYTQDTAQGIIEAVGWAFQTVDAKLDKNERRIRKVEESLGQIKRSLLISI